jgi:hypothetical protein
LDQRFGCTNAGVTFTIVTHPGERIRLCCENQPSFLLPF